MRRVWIAVVTICLAASELSAGLVKKRSRWPVTAFNRRIPVYIHDSIPNESANNPCVVDDRRERCRIREAVARWNSTARTMIELYEVSSPPANGSYVVFRHYPDDEDNDSALAQTAVGWQGPGAHEIKKIADVDAGSLVHELAHVFGLDHEHQRPDRDQFIKLTVQDTADVNYRIEELTTHVPVGTYDFRSIMHYSAHFWQSHRDGPRALQSQNLRTNEVGDVGGLSMGDFDAIRSLYCDDALLPCPNFTPAQNTLSSIPVQVNHQRRTEQPAIRIRRP